MLLDVGRWDMKKKTIVFGMAVVLIFVGLGGCGEKSSENGDNNESSFFSYENTENGISIEYPTTWNKYDNPPEVPDVLVLFV